MAMTWEDRAEEFLSKKARYQLVGRLDTEGFNPKTERLSQWAQSDPKRAFEAFKEVDLDALRTIETGHLDKIEALRAKIDATFARGGNVIGYSMGAPYRANIDMQCLFSRQFKNTQKQDRFKALGTGGMVSMFTPVRYLEDRPDVGARQIREIGLSDNDLAICFVEGGETPSVGGAAVQAARITDDNVQMFYCNPDEQLNKIEDVRTLYENPKIDRHAMPIGSPALAGSTRLQPSTVLELVIGAALLQLGTDDVKRFIEFVSELDYCAFVPFMEAEADIYQKGEYTLYRAKEYASVVSGNQTELCPTFGIRAFENYNPKIEPQNQDVSWSYLSVIGTHSVQQAHRYMTGGPPRTIEWPSLKKETGQDCTQVRLNGFDVSENAMHNRLSRVPGPMHQFNILKQDNRMTFLLGDNYHEIDISGLHPLFQHLLLKIILNAHSTIMMGRLGRYNGNAMDDVRPDLNFKIADRSIRLAWRKLDRLGVPRPSYDETARVNYRHAAKIGEGDGKALDMTVEYFRRQHTP